uniref:Uncharacterized protein n=1 Tax=Avena sativa TaxID=4498 RepID=A0ACD5TSZ5_AVESA
MSLNHGVADGTTFWHLFNTWSEISRRRWSGRDDVEMISTPPPVLDRWFLDSCPVPIPLPLGKLEKCISMVVQRAEAPVQECVFHFPAESVRKLKARANAEVAASESETAMTVSISSLQAVLAHLWRAACRARGLLANEQETAYAFAVGCRGRVAGVPATYSGNALSSAVARAAAREILDQDHGLGRAAWLLNRGVASVDETSEREKLASWAHSPMFACPQAFVGTGSLLMGSSPRFNVYGNDFGWGAPVAVRSGSASKVDGMTTVYEDGGGPGGMALEVCLTPEALARLVADDEFMSATTPHTARLI